MPESTETRYHLALALAKAGDKERARKEIKALVQAGKKLPDDAEIQRLLD